MGPPNTARQRDYVAGLCEEARAAGAEVLTAGEFVGGHDGTYLLPLLVPDPAHELTTVTEEQFGPAVPVIPYDVEAEAVAMANNTWSGLCSSVWSADTEHAMHVARQLRTGSRSSTTTTPRSTSARRSAGSTAAASAASSAARDCCSSPRATS